jgi:hypothetical protein
MISGRPRQWDYPDSGSGPGFRYETGIEELGEEASAIELWSQGVCIETLPAPGLAFRAVVHLATLRRDLSQMKVVRDATVTAALAAVDDARGKALAMLAEHDRTWDDSTRPNRWPKMRVDEVLGRPLREREASDVEEAGGQLIGPGFYLFSILCGFSGVALIVGHEFHIGLVMLLIFLLTATVGTWLFAKALAAHERMDRRKEWIMRGKLFGLAVLLSICTGLMSLL